MDEKGSVEVSGQVQTDSVQGNGKGMSGPKRLNVHDADCVGARE